MPGNEKQERTDSDYSYAGRLTCSGLHWKEEWKRRIYLSEYGLLFGSKKDKGLGKIFENGDSGRNI